MGRGLSEGYVREIGNANALGGGTKETFGQALLAISQMAAKPKVSGQELLQLINAGIPVPKLLKSAFGTGDPEELAKQGRSSAEVLSGLLRELEKLPRVAGGAQNSIDNLQDSLKFASVEFGRGLAEAGGKALDALSTSLSDLIDSGNFQSFGETLAEIFNFDPSSSALTEGIIQVEGFFIRLSVTMQNMAAVAGQLLNALVYLPDTLFGIARIIADLTHLDVNAAKKDWDALVDHVKTGKPTGDTARAAAMSMGGGALPLLMMMDGMNPDDFYGNTQADAFMNESRNRLRMRKEHPKKPNPSLPVESANQAATQVAEQTDLLRKIAFFTEKTAAHLERHAFGGGDLGRIGVTPIEVSGMIGQAMRSRMVASARG
jgi:tape measure domain-containing protein